ncbi:hypothetical protein G6514_008309 [Epicoccum nigrum]|nr:hypothetical protein G6514_008309 [Epicoccum nigrum]
MARGNQRDKAREKNLKEQAGKKGKNTVREKTATPRIRSRNGGRDGWDAGGVFEFSRV